MAGSIGIHIVASLAHLISGQFDPTGCAAWSYMHSESQLIGVSIWWPAHDELSGLSHHR